MKLMPSLLVLLISGIVSPVAVAGQQGFGNELGQKARPEHAASLLQHEQVMLAQTTQSQQTKAQYERTIGVCTLINNPPNAPKEPWAGSSGMSPAVAVGNYFRIAGKKPDFKDDGGEVRVKILENPKHGVLQDAGDESYYYFPDTGYLGKDRVTFLVEMGGRKYKVVHYVQMMEIVPEYYGRNKLLCPNGNYWKISTTLNPDGTNTITSVEPSTSTLSPSPSPASGRGELRLVRRF